MLLAAPVLISTLLMLTMDRTAQTGFFNDAGRRQLVPLREPVLDLRPPRGLHPRAARDGDPARDPARVLAQAALGLPPRGRPGCSASRCSASLVWQHHLFVSGINADLRPFYMLSTELISLPTGFIFVCALGTLWAGRIRLTVPMLFSLAWLFNFLIGGLSGVFLSDVPSDVTTHGSFFSMAHFHYTIMGGLLFSFFAGIYYWVPKMTGYEINERLGKVALLGRCSSRSTRPSGRCS